MTGGGTRALRTSRDVRHGPAGLARSATTRPQSRASQPRPLPQPRASSSAASRCTPPSTTLWISTRGTANLYRYAESRQDRLPQTGGGPVHGARSIAPKEEAEPVPPPQERHPESRRWAVLMLAGRRLPPLPNALGSRGLWRCAPGASRQFLRRLLDRCADPADAPTVTDIRSAGRPDLTDSARSLRDFNHQPFVNPTPQSTAFRRMGSDSY